MLSSLALAAHVHRVELSQSPAFSSGSDRSGATAWEIVAPQRDGEGDDGESCYNERGYTRPRHALAAGCRIKRVCRPTLSLTLAAGTTSARLPITELIVATLAHSASAPTQQHLREVIALYEQWAAGTVKSPAFYIVGILRAFIDTRRSGALELVVGSLLWLSPTLAAKKLIRRA